METFFAYPLTDRQRALLERAEPLAIHFAERAAQHDVDASFPFENFADLRAAGLLALTVPESYGGLGADVLDYVPVLERIAWGDASTGLVLGMHLSNIGQLVEGNLWAEHHAALFREIVEQGVLLNAAQAEPEMGSPSFGGVPATVARADGAGGWRLTGRKIYTTGAPGLRYFLVLAAVEQLDRPTQLGTFLVRNDTPGVHVEKTWDAMALRASGSDDLILEDAHVTADALLELRAVGTPDPRAALGLPWGTLTLAVVYTGLALAARDEVAHFAATRVPTALGKPIGELPTVRLRLGEIEGLLLTSRRLLYGLAADWVQHPELRPQLRAQAPLVKYVATNNAVRITDLALRIAGGSSLQRTSRLQQLFRDARAGLVNAPPDDATLQNAGKLAVDAASKQAK